MIRDEQEFASRIKGYLDSGAAGMRAGTAYRLQQARASALARLGERASAAEPRLVHALMGASGGHPGSRRDGSRKGAWFALGVALVAAAAFFGYHQWQSYQNTERTREIAELDVQILTSDLPIDAYIDRGFQAWLTSYQR